MDLKDKIVVVTGAASGIGRALCLRFATEGARKVVCVDRDSAGAAKVAALTGGVAKTVDVSQEAQIAQMIQEVEAEVGPIDLFCSNAGIFIDGGMEVPNDDWQRIWDINVMAHVWAARHVAPLMVARGGGYLLNTSSAAGLLNQVGAAPYAVSKHAALGLAEWLAMTYGDDGIKVSVLCPQGVATRMTEGMGDNVAMIDGLMEADAVAVACVQAIREEHFLVLPHAEVLGYMQKKSSNYDRWIGGMRKLHRTFVAGRG